MEREQNDAYQAFLKERDPSRKSRGAVSLRKYPKSLLVEQIDAGLMDTYRMQADWKDEYDFADRARAESQ